MLSSYREVHVRINVWYVYHIIIWNVKKLVDSAWDPKVYLRNMFLVQTIGDPHSNDPVCSDKLH